MRDESSTPVRHRAVVLTPGYVHYPNGTARQTTPSLHRNPAGILAGQLAQHATVVVDGASVDEHQAHADAVKAAGWEFSRIGPWTLYRKDDRTVSIGIRPEMHPVHHLSVLFTADTDPGTLAVILDRFNGLINNSWRGTCATTAHAAIRLTWANDRYQPLWTSDKKGPGYASGPIIWSRPLNEWERTWGWVHTFDANAAYLAAMINAELAWSEIHHTGSRAFDPKAPGYWQLQLRPRLLAALGDDRRPPILPRARIRDGMAWVTTPLVVYLGQLGHQIDVVDSWTGQEHHKDGRRIHPAASRILRPWGEAMRDARTVLDAMPPGALRDVLEYAHKRTYKDATGGMQRRTMRVARADWAHTFIDLSRANLLRTCDRIHTTEGIWPVAIKTDALTYADCGETTPLAGVLGVRPGLGGWKHAETVDTATWLEHCS